MVTGQIEPCITLEGVSDSNQTHPGDLQINTLPACWSEVIHNSTMRL